MRVLGWLLAGAVLLTALKAALVGIALLTILLIVLALSVRPRETLTILLALTLIDAFAAQPALGFIFFTAITLGSKLAKNQKDHEID